jgi:hypothetical protein
MSVGKFLDMFLFKTCYVYADPEDIGIHWKLYMECELLRDLAHYKAGRKFRGISLQDGVLNFDEQFLYPVPLPIPV